MFSFKTFLTKFSKQTLTVKFYFRCNFLLVVAADINTKVYIDFAIPSSCIQTFSGIGRVKCYMPIKYKEELGVFVV